MLSEDTYRQKLRELAASVRAWSGFIADVARVEIGEDGGHLRIRMEPRASRACPVELLIDDRQPVCDLTIAGETYEGWQLPRLEAVLPMLEAVAAGRVITRHATSAATRIGYGVSTEIRLADGTSLTPASNGVAGSPGEHVEMRNTHYLPYRKP